MITYKVVLKHYPDADRTPFKIDAADVNLEVDGGGEEGGKSYAYFNFTNSDDVTVAAIPFDEVLYITKN